MYEWVRRFQLNTWILLLVTLVGIPAILALDILRRPIGPMWLLWRHEQDFEKGSSVIHSESANAWEFVGSKITKVECNAIKKKRLKASVNINRDWIEIDGGEKKIHFVKDGFRFPFMDRDVEIKFLCFPVTVEPRQKT